MVLVLCIVAALGSVAPSAGESPGADARFPCHDVAISQYTAYRTEEIIRVDGRLDEAGWQRVPRSPRFVDLISGGRSIHDTRAAVLWDETNLYVGFWVEEPDVRGDLTEHDSPVWQNNDVEVFIAGAHAYFEFGINSLGTVYDSFLMWEETYDQIGFGAVPDFRRSHPGLRQVNGVGFKTHPRGTRLRASHWSFPGLQTAVHVDGTLNDGSDRDRGWRVEVAFPWEGMEWLATDGRPLPPQDGDVWRIDFSRFNRYKEAPPAQDSGAFAWSPHGIWDSHIPECFPYVRFSGRDVSQIGPSQRCQTTCP